MSAPETPCPLCGGDGEPAFTVGRWAHRRCRGCASVFVAPPPSPEELVALYRQAADGLGSASCWDSSARHAEATWARALDDARRLAGAGPLLDVGCGAGQFLAFAAARGFAPLHGLELAPAIAAAARARSGAAVQEAELLAAALPGAAFAAVSLWDVLEHLRDPRAALRHVAALLRPGGVVLVGTPSREGVTLRALGRHARVVSPPEHLFYATRRGLATALAAEGFTLRRLETEQIRIRDWLPAGAGAPGRGGAPAAYARAYALLTGRAALAAQRAANAVLRATGLGDQLLAVAQRA